MATTVAVIVAAGRGNARSGGRRCPKQYLPLAGVPVLAHSLRVLAGHPQIDATIVVINPDDRDLYDAAAAPFAARLSAPVPEAQRGRNRCWPVSRRSAVNAPDRVLIHDAARPFLTADLVTRLLGALDDTPAPSPPSPSATR